VHDAIYLGSSLLWGYTTQQTKALYGCDLFYSCLTFSIPVLQRRVRYLFGKGFPKCLRHKDRLSPRRVYKLEIEQYRLDKSFSTFRNGFRENCELDRFWVNARVAECYYHFTVPIVYLIIRPYVFIIIIIIIFQYNTLVYRSVGWGHFAYNILVEEGWRACSLPA